MLGANCRQSAGAMSQAFMLEGKLMSVVVDFYDALRMCEESARIRGRRTTGFRRDWVLSIAVLCRNGRMGLATFLGLSRLHGPSRREGFPDRQGLLVDIAFALATLVSLPFVTVIGIDEAIGRFRGRWKDRHFLRAARKNRMIRPPGRVVGSLLRTVFGENAWADRFSHALADMEKEYFDALFVADRAKARCALARGYIGIAKAVAVHMHVDKVAEYVNQLRGS